MGSRTISAHEARKHDKSSLDYSSSQNHIKTSFGKNVFISFYVVAHDDSYVIRRGRFVALSHQANNRDNQRPDIRTRMPNLRKATRSKMPRTFYNFCIASYL